jgi:hypothetical protein
MPAVVIDDPLGINCVFSSGKLFQATVGPNRNSRLARDLMTALVELIHPRGGVNAAGTVRLHMFGIHKVLAWTDERGFAGGLADLTRALVADFLMSQNAANEHTLRQLLVAFGSEIAPLSTGVLEFASGRAFNSTRRRDSTPLQPYSETEWERLRTECLNVVKSTYAENRRATQAAERGVDPAIGGWNWENSCWLLTQLGPSATNLSVGRMYGTSEFAIWRRQGVVPARTALFPRADVTVAYKLLFGIYTGIVPDGIAGLGTDDVDWAGDAAVLLSYIKGRTSAESIVLSPRAVRLLEQWLSHSDLLRQFTPENQRGDLWLRHAPGANGQVPSGPPNGASARRWAKQHNLLAEDGSPLQIHSHRVRTTFESLRDRKAWFGSARAVIDPNHTPAVEGDHYLTAATQAQRNAVDGIIEQAQGDLIRKTHPPMVLSAEEAGEVAERFPELIEQLKLDDAAVAELVGGERDVFVAGCADQLAGVHGPAGKPCPARPWVCLLCPLALFAPRHAANLLRLKAYFARQWQLMPSTQFMKVFGPYAARLDDILGHYPPALVTEATRQVGGNDEEIALRPEEGTA